MTFTYKLYTFENGLGETIYQVKYKGGWFHLWIWTWMLNPFDLMNYTPLYWITREGAMKAIRAHAERRRDTVLKKGLDAKRAKLKLIVIEEVEG